MTRLTLEAFSVAQDTSRPLHAARSTPSEDPDLHVAKSGTTPGEGRYVAGRALSGSLSVLRSCKESSVDDDFFSRLFEELKAGGYPLLTRPQFDWAVRRVKGRARTPPATQAFWRKSLTTLMANFPTELENYYTERAAELMARGERIGLFDDLVTDALANDLPYDRDILNDAIDRADARGTARAFAT